MAGGGGSVEVELVTSTLTTFAVSGVQPNVTELTHERCFLYTHSTRGCYLALTGCAPPPPPRIMLVRRTFPRAVHDWCSVNANCKSECCGTLKFLPECVRKYKGVMW